MVVMELVWLSADWPVDFWASAGLRLLERPGYDGSRRKGVRRKRGSSVGFSLPQVQFANSARPTRHQSGVYTHLQLLLSIHTIYVYILEVNVL